MGAYRYCAIKVTGGYPISANNLIFRQDFIKAVGVIFSLNGADLMLDIFQKYIQTGIIKYEICLPEFYILWAWIQLGELPMIKWASRHLVVDN